jgi:hypothetical protein
MVLNLRRVNRVLEIVIVTFFMLMLISQTAYATSVDDNSELITIPDYIYSYEIYFWMTCIQIHWNNRTFKTMMD